MVHNTILSPKFSYINPRFHKNQLHALPYLQYSKRGRKFFLPLSVSSIPYQPIDVDYLEEEFSGQGVTFEPIGEGQCVAKMNLQNGSSAALMLPGGLVTSYKALMWHGGSVELLHTVVSEGQNGGNPVIQGGISTTLLLAGENNESSWSPSTWNLHNIKGDPEDFIQVELISSQKDKMVETKQILTLKEDKLSSHFVISNSGPSPLQLTGSIISHLTVSSPEATFAVGLDGSNFQSIPPFLSSFSLIPPVLKEESSSGFGKFLDQIAGRGLSSSSSNRNNEEEEMENEEDESYKQLDGEMSMIYTNSPTYFTIIDRGRRNSVVLGRDGFDELYLFSPGSNHEIYGKYAYVCVGQSALLKPIILGSGEVWEGGHHLQNPNFE